LLRKIGLREARKMFGSLGFAEVLFIMAIALLVFGPKRLPEVGRTLGKGLREFRKASNELRQSVQTEIEIEEPPVPAAVPTRATTRAIGAKGTEPRGTVEAGGTDPGDSTPEVEDETLAEAFGDKPVEP